MTTPYRPASTPQPQPFGPEGVLMWPDGSVYIPAFGDGSHPATAGRQIAALDALARRQQAEINELRAQLDQRDNQLHDTTVAWARGQTPPAVDRLPLPAAIAVLEHRIEDYYTNGPEDEGYPDASDVDEWKDQLRDLIDQAQAGQR